MYEANFVILKFKLLVKRNDKENKTFVQDHFIQISFSVIS